MDSFALNFSPLTPRSPLREMPTPAPYTGRGDIFGDVYIDDVPTKKPKLAPTDAPKRKVSPKLCPKVGKGVIAKIDVRAGLKAKGLELIDKGGSKVVREAPGAEGATDAAKGAVKDRPIDEKNAKRIADAYKKIQPVLDKIAKGGVKLNPLKVAGVNGTINDKGTGLSDTTLGELIDWTVILTDLHLKEVSAKFAEFTLVHEFMHFFLGHFDCRNVDGFHGNTAENPLVKDYDKARKGEKAPTKYGDKNIDEDLADSATLYLLYPHTLKKLAPKRFEFFRKLFTPSPKAYGADVKPPRTLVR